MRLVSISNILDISKGFQRLLIEGEAVLDSKHLIAVGRLRNEKGDGIVNIHALCLQTSGIFDEPHKIIVVLDSREVKDRIKSTSCSCKAGTSEKCKHIVATLMHLNKIENEEELDELSSTHLEQQWGKLKLSVRSDFEATPITDYCHFPEKVTSIYTRGIPDISEEIASEIAEFILADECDSAIYLHKSDTRAAASAKNCSVQENAIENAQKSEKASLVIRQLLERSAVNASACLINLKKLTEAKVESLAIYLRNFYEENVKVSTEKSITIASSTVNQSDDELWFKERKLRITCSNLFSLFTYCANKKQNWEKKFSSVFKSGFSGNKATIHGVICEPTARAAYTDQEKKSVIETGLFIQPDLPWLGYSPDGLVMNENNEPEFLLEIQSPLIGQSVPASCIASEVSFYVIRKLLN